MHGRGWCLPSCGARIGEADQFGFFHEAGGVGDRMKTRHHAGLQKQQHGPRAVAAASRKRAPMGLSDVVKRQPALSATSPVRPSIRCRRR